MTDKPAKPARRRTRVTKPRIVARRPGTSPRTPLSPSARTSSRSSRAGLTSSGTGFAPSASSPPPKTDLALSHPWLIAALTRHHVRR